MFRQFSKSELHFTNEPLFIDEVNNNILQLQKLVNILYFNDFNARCLPEMVIPILKVLDLVNNNSAPNQIFYFIESLHKLGSIYLFNTDPNGGINHDVYKHDVTTIISKVVNQEVRINGKVYTKGNED